MSTLKVRTQDATGVVYADPSEPDLAIRFRHSSGPKTLNGAPTQNHVTEIIISDENPVTIGSVAAVDAVSVRLRTSCSAASAARLKVLLVALAAQLDSWSDESVFQGFNPETAPVVPAV